MRSRSLAFGTHGRRPNLPFRAVNRRGTQFHDPGLQRHHLLPRQLVGMTAFAMIFEHLGRGRIGFEDFRRNGLLLPANDSAALRMGMPLHRGPHRHYNTMVIERVGEIEHDWRCRSPRNCDRASEEALVRLAELQLNLRARLLNPGPSPLLLHNKDPLGSGFDYRELDAMAEQLWRATYRVQAR